MRFPLDEDVDETLSEMSPYLTVLLPVVFQERHNAKTVGEIKQFVAQLPHMQAARGSLANHTSIAELIKDVTSKCLFLWS